MFDFNQIRNNIPFVAKRFEIPEDIDLFEAMGVQKTPPVISPEVMAQAIKEASAIVGITPVIDVPSTMLGIENAETRFKEVVAEMQNLKSDVPQRLGEAYLQLEKKVAATGYNGAQLRKADDIALKAVDIVITSNALIGEVVQGNTKKVVAILLNVSSAYVGLPEYAKILEEIVILTQVGATDKAEAVFQTFITTIENMTA